MSIFILRKRHKPLKKLPLHTLQNGVVERKHKHVLQVARPLQFQGNVPQRFWGESLLMATCLINRTPGAIMSWKILYEQLYNKPPSYNNQKVYGCLAFAKDVGPSSDKFSSRGRKCPFSGYDLEKKVQTI